MGGRQRGALIAAAILPALMALVACKGGTTGPAAGSPTAPAAAVTALCAPLAQAERLRYSFAYTVESPRPQGSVDETAVGSPLFALSPNSPDFAVSQQFDGAVENPGKVDVTITTAGSAGTLRMIIIGPDQWMLVGERWAKSQAQAVPFPPVDMCNAVLSGLDLTGLTPVEETVDGEIALRYEAQGVALDTAVKIWTEQSDMGRILKTYTVKVWLSKDKKVPLRMESTTTGAYPSGRELKMEVSLSVKDVDASDIKVEPPS